MRCVLAGLPLLGMPLLGFLCWVYLCWVAYIVKRITYPPAAIK